MEIFSNVGHFFQIGEMTHSKLKKDKLIKELMNTVQHLTGKDPDVQDCGAKGTGRCDHGFK